MLNKIRELLEEFGYQVFYGRSLAKEKDDWNYFVFNKDRIKKSGTSKKDFNKYFQIHFIHEEYIPEDFEFEIIKKIEENTKLKLSDRDVEFNYMLKNNTDLIVEMCTIEFTLPKKGCNV